jgi:hypothetical protein
MFVALHINRKEYCQSVGTCGYVVCGANVELIVGSKIYKISFCVYFIYAGQVVKEENVKIGQDMTQRNASLLSRGELDNGDSDALLSGGELDNGDSDALLSRGELDNGDSDALLSRGELDNGDSDALLSRGGLDSGDSDALLSRGGLDSGDSDALLSRGELDNIDYDLLCWHWKKRRLRIYEVRFISMAGFAVVEQPKCGATISYTKFILRLFLFICSYMSE